MNSSSPTVFSFTGWSSAFSEHHGQLALSPALLEEVRRRLEDIGMQVVELIKEEAVGERSTERMERLKQLSELPTKEPAPGDTSETLSKQYTSLTSPSSSVQQKHLKVS